MEHAGWKKRSAPMRPANNSQAKTSCWRMPLAGANQRERRRAASTAADPDVTMIDFRGYAYTRTPSKISGELVTTYDPKTPQIWHVPFRKNTRPSLVVTAPRGGIHRAAGLCTGNRRQAAVARYRVSQTQPRRHSCKSNASGPRRLNSPTHLSKDALARICEAHGRPSRARFQQVRCSYRSIRPARA